MIQDTAQNLIAIRRFHLTEVRDLNTFRNCTQFIDTMQKSGSESFTCRWLIRSPLPPLLLFTPFAPLHYLCFPLLPSAPPCSLFAPFAVDISAEGATEGAMECSQKGSQKGP